MAGTPETIDEGGGSAAAQGDLWGERARDWADVLEGWNGWGLDAYRNILERVTVQRGTKLLDMGCGVQPHRRRSRRPSRGHRRHRGLHRNRA